MKNRKEIEAYVNRISKKDAIEAIRELAHRDIQNTKAVIEKGISPLSEKSPYIPHFFGRLYAEEGEKGLIDLPGLNETGIKRFLVKLIEVDESLNSILEK